MLVALLLPAMLERVSDRRVMLASGALMATTLAITAGVWAGMSGQIGWPHLLPAWLALGMAYAGLLTPGGRLLRRSARTSDLPQLFAAQFSLSHVCWLLAYPLAGWAGATWGLGTALLALTALALAGAGAAWGLWPSRDADVLPHEHPDLPADHPHRHEHDASQDGSHRHPYVIDDLHRRWPT